VVDWLWVEFVDCEVFAVASVASIRACAFACTTAAVPRPPVRKSDAATRLFPEIKLINITFSFLS
jgi:hypothetical protein